MHSLYSYNFDQIWSMTVLDKETELTLHPNKQILKFGPSIWNHLCFKYIHLKMEKEWNLNKRKLQIENSVSMSLYCVLQLKWISSYSWDFHAATSLSSLLRTCCLPWELECKMDVFKHRHCLAKTTSFFYYYLFIFKACNFRWVFLQSMPWSQHVYKVHKYPSLNY